eukprot:1154267-Pelagomonas_calceolata.AAC.1
MAGCLKAISFFLAPSHAASTHFEQEVGGLLGLQEPGVTPKTSGWLELSPSWETEMKEPWPKPGYGAYGASNNPPDPHYNILFVASWWRGPTVLLSQCVSFSSIDVGRVSSAYVVFLFFSDCKRFHPAGGPGSTKHTSG